MIVRESESLRRQYMLTQDAYTGAGGFKSGSYLYSYEREFDFKDRMNQVSYLNLLQPIVDAKYIPIFNSDVQREYEEDEIIEMFINDCDNNGTHIQDVIKHAVKQTILLGNSFIIVDNFKAPEDITVSEVLEERLIPYVYTKEVSDVFEYKVDEFNKLEYIAFYYDELSDEDGNKTIIYKGFDQHSIQYFGITVVDEQEIRKEISRSVHNLGVVPIVYRNKEILPFPPYYSMSTIARQVFNTSSEINDLARSQNFSVLTLPSQNPGEAAKEAIVFGNKSVLFYDSESTHTPGYISPDSAIIKASLEYKDGQVGALLQAADVLGSMAVQSGGSAESGVALSYKFFGKVQALKDSGLDGTYYELGVIDIVQMYMNLDVVYVVEYPTSFAPTMMEVERELAVLERVGDMEISDFVSDRVDVDIVKLVAKMGGWNDEDTTRALDSIISE